jgi:hypothetical protein
MTLVPLGGGEGSPPSVAILLFNGAQLIDFAGPWEVLVQPACWFTLLPKSRKYSPPYSREDCS